MIALYKNYSRTMDMEARKALREISKARDAQQRADEKLREARRNKDLVKSARAEADLMEAKAKEKTAMDAAYSVLNWMGKTRADFSEKYFDETSVNPEHVDTAAVELLRSGVMRPRDYAVMADKYDKNPTMLRLIAQYAKGAADALKDDDPSASAFRSVNLKLQNDVNGEKYIAALSSIEDTFKRCLKNPSLIQRYDPLTASLVDHEPLPEEEDK